MKLFPICFFIGLAIETTASPQPGSSNVVVLAGKKTELSCNTGRGLLGVDWYFIAAGGTEEIKLSSKSQIFSAAKDFSVNGQIPGESLSINSTELKHAGRYTCTALMRQENGSRTDVARFSAEVIVLECDLNTSSVREGDKIVMWCIVRYSGIWIPMMEWRKLNINISINGIVTESTSNRLTSTLNVSAEGSEHNSSYLCLTYFSESRNQSMKSNTANFPVYNHTWTSPSLNISYGPKKALVSPVKKFYSDGDEVVCSAEANPIPRFEWKILENNKTFDGPVFVVRSEMITDDSISIQCTAINEAIALQVESLIITIKTQGYWSTIKIVIIFVVLCAAVLVFLVLVVIQNSIKEWIAKAYKKPLVEEREVDGNIVPLGIYQYPVVDFENGVSSLCGNNDEQKTTGEHSKLMNGANGEVTYEQMNASGLKSTVASPVGPSLFSASIYASIDHTLRVPPPPPPPKQRHL